MKNKSFNEAIISQGNGDISIISCNDPKLEAQNHVIIKHIAFGLNYDDTRVVAGIIPNPSSTGVLGVEACGVIEELGPGCKRGYKKGDVVAYATYRAGAFLKLRSVNENYLIPLPSYVKPAVGATLLKGLMAYTLLGKVFVINKGATILLTGASGAIGSMVSQLASANNTMKVIALTSNSNTDSYLTRNGASLVINYKREDVSDKVQEFTKGNGADFYFDCLGTDSDAFAFECLKTRGIFIHYGQITGPSYYINLELQRLKSITVASVSLHHHITNYNDFMNCAFAYIKSLQSSLVKPQIIEYKWKEAKQALHDIKAGGVFGQKVLLAE